MQDGIYMRDDRPLLCFIICVLVHHGRRAQAITPQAVEVVVGIDVCNSGCV